MTTMQRIQETTNINFKSATKDRTFAYYYYAQPQYEQLFKGTKWLKHQTVTV